MSSESDHQSSKVQGFVDDEPPAEFEPGVRGLADIAREPSKKPLATLGTVLVLAAFGYQALAAAGNHHPAVGLLVVVVAAVAYRISRRLWAIQHRHVVRELSNSGTLDDLR